MLMTSSFLWIPKQAVACSCAMKNSPDEELKRSFAVFQGKVLKKETKRYSLFTSSSADPVYVTFTVHKVWKGIDTKTITIQTAVSGASCGYDFHQNQEYIVYAIKSNGKLEVNLCSRTSELSQANDDIQYLGTQIKVERELKKGIENKPMLFIQVWISIGVLFVFILLIVFMIVKGRKKNGK